MRRIALIISLALTIAACSDTAATTTTPSEDTTPDAATVSTSTTTTTTTTAAPPTTTTTAPGAGTTAVSFDTAPGTPPHVFDSFATVMTMTMNLGDLAIAVSADGVWTEEAFRCTVSSGMGGINFSESVVATTTDIWIDTGNGYEPTDLFGSSAQEIMSSCPASPLFWASFASEDFASIDGDQELINGRPAVKADLAGLMKELGGIGVLSGFDGATINQMTMWIDVETNTVIAMIADMEMSEDLMSDFGAEGTGAAGIVMDLEISQVNDPNLTVALP